MGMLEQDDLCVLEVTKKKATDLFLSIIGSIEECDTRHLEALKHLRKSGMAIKSTFDSMKKQKNELMKMEPTVKGWNRKIDKQRKFFATTKRRKRGNVRFTKPTDEDRATFLNSNEFNISDSEALSKNIV